MTDLDCKPNINIVCGATASGKSSMALEIAEKNNGVIINADSIQLYKDLRTLTARPSADEERAIPHALYGVLDADKKTSMGSWVLQAKKEIDTAHEQGKTPIIVGGTGLYIKTLINGITHIPPVSDETRKKVSEIYNEIGKDEFKKRVAEVDKELTDKFSDKQRLIRAMEVYTETAKPLSEWQKVPPEKFYDALQFEIHNAQINRVELYKRCDARFLAMIEQGAIDEVKAFKEKMSGSFENYPITKALGFKELSAHLDGDITLDEAMSQAQQSTRRYAKRQATWFRNQM